MAHYALIDGYLDAFRTEVRWRSDADDLVAEIGDHLYSTVERFEARGANAQLAQRQTLQRFGEPDLIADVFAHTPRGGIAVPTKFSKTAGKVALFASGLWLVAIALFFAQDLTRDWDTALYFTWSASILGAGVLTLIATLGLRQRHGNLGALGTTGVVILGIGVVASFLSWAIPGWMTIQGLGMLLVMLSIRPMGVAPRTPMFAYGSGMLIGAITFFVLTAMKVGTPDRYGDYPVAWGTGLTVGLIIVAAGLLGIGRWLTSEQPADVNIPDHTLTA